MEPAGEEGPGHRPTTPAASSSHDRRGHPQVCAHAEAGGEHHSPGRSFHASADNESQSRKGSCGNDQTRQLGGAHTNRPTPSAKPLGKSSGRTEVVGSSGFPHCQLHLAATDHSVRERGPRIIPVRGLLTGRQSARCPGTQLGMIHSAEKTLGYVTLTLGKGNPSGGKWGAPEQVCYFHLHQNSFRGSTHPNHSARCFSLRR